eukprot:TRINITY_DN4035_c0_g1_i1.p1 TRINITY_DN4035_c0_g1~~TRINITY_DN4035_c0_g1_i1.p1  ORF type:complete len:295 (+),score=57.51 TRINITY_DN4035_c0_g1_i1:72-956(+)
MEEDDFTCSFCGEIFREATILPCGHSLCLQCVKTIEEGSTAKKIEPKCSECSQSWLIGSKMIPNYHLRSTIDKISRDNSKPLLQSAISSSSLNMCKKHPNEDIKAVCVVCNNIVVCGDCVLFGDHVGHKTLMISEYKNEIDRILLQQRANYEEIKKKCEEMMKSIEKVRIEEEMRKMELTEMIDKQFEALHKTLDERKEVLKQQVSSVFVPKVKVIDFEFKFAKEKRELLDSFQKHFESSPSNLNESIEKKMKNEEIIKFGSMDDSHDNISPTVAKYNLDIETLNEEIKKIWAH